MVSPLPVWHEQKALIEPTTHKQLFLNFFRNNGVNDTLLRNSREIAVHNFFIYMKFL